MTRCSPEFAFACEMDLALTYALSRPQLAAACASTALDHAIMAGRPDLAYRANDLLSTLEVRS
jgi:hypothetical protein